jgi:hypothetical protein
VKKILFISLAVVLGLSVGLIGCDGGGPVGPTPSSKIIISASVSATGVLELVHGGAKLPLVNTYVAANPTITVGSTTFDVELDLRDDASNLANMLDNTDDIIDDIGTGDSHFLLGPTCTAFLEAQALKCTTAKVVQMTMEGGATSLFEELENYEYSFISLSFSNWFEIPVLAKMLVTAENWTAADHAYIGYQNDDHGLEYLGQAQKYFGKEGITIDGSFAMDSGSTTANSELVSAAKLAGSEILCVFAYPEFVMSTHAEADGQAYEPKAMILGPGANFGFWGGAAGNYSEGVMCFATANNKTTGNAGTVIQTMEAATPAYTDYWGHPCYWAAMDFIYAGAENEGSDNAGDGFTIDQNDFRSYCAETKLDSAFGQSWFVTPSVVLNSTTYSWTDSQLQWPVPDGYAALLNYKCHTGEIGQWQNGYIEIVGYDGIGGGSDEYGLTNYDTTATFIYPKPAWP